MKKELESTRRKKAIIFGIKPHWDVSKLPATILADYLIKESYEVIYISDDLSLFHFLKWKLNTKILKSFLKTIFKGEKKKNILYCSSFALFPHYNNVNSLYFFLHKYLNIKFQSRFLHNILSDNYELAFCASYRNHKDFIDINSIRKIFSIEDNPKGFGILSHELVDKVDKKIEDNAHIELWCTSKVLIKEIYKNANYYSNGINNNFDINLIHNSNKKCVYVGAIEEWFDWDLINSVFIYLGEKYGYSLDIYGISSNDINKKILTEFIKFKGPIQNTDVQKTLQKYSVGVIPFKKNQLIKYVNPIKYYEYLSSGLRTVATDWEELQELEYKHMFLSNAENFAKTIIDANNTLFESEDGIGIFLKSKKYDHIFKNVFKI